MCGPYTYTDGYYYWDRDIWKYVLKYHVTLPREFIKHVMSDEGTAYLKEQEQATDSWTGRIQNLKKQEGVLCLLPDNAGAEKLKDF